MNRHHRGHRALIALCMISKSPYLYICINFKIGDIIPRPVTHGHGCEGVAIKRHLCLRPYIRANLRSLQWQDGRAPDALTVPAITPALWSSGFALLVVWFVGDGIHHASIPD